MSVLAPCLSSKKELDRAPGWVAVRGAGNHWPHMLSLLHQLAVLQQDQPNLLLLPLSLLAQRLLMTMQGARNGGHRRKL